MAEQLSQSQIDALLKKMSSGDDVEVKEEKKVREYDFTLPKKFTKEQLKSLDRLYETFSRMLSSYLSGMLRTVCDVQVLQIEEQRYYEYNNALPDTSLIGVADFIPEDDQYNDSKMLLSFPTNVGFYFVDRLLGGEGKAVDLNRDYTEIEIAVLGNVLSKIVSRLEDAWRTNLDVGIQMNSIETNSRLLQVFAPDDIVIIVVLNVKIMSFTTSLSICISAECLEDVIDNFSIKYAKSNKKTDLEREQVRKELLLQGVCDTDLQIKAIFDEFTVELKDILQLQPMDIIPLNKKVTDDINITLNGIPWFTAKLGETKQRKAIKLNNLIEK